MLYETKRVAAICRYEAVGSSFRTRSSAAVSGSATGPADREVPGLRGAHLHGRGDDPLYERFRMHLRGVLDQVACHLGRGRDDRVEVALVAGRLEHAAHDARGPGVAALDRGRGQQYLADQRGSRRQVPQRRRVQVPARGVVVACGERDPGQQQAAPGRGQAAGQLGRGAQVAEREAQQGLQLIGPGQLRGRRSGQDGSAPPRQWPAHHGSARGRPRSRRGRAGRDR